ncbi:MAG: alcohol dehydrogenase catalytic domain-containing protein [Novosphingobium sp.]|nr:alcohol dehydrogenase catalytic domain-containing protein [Novosphingobium sp.]MCP5403410.1 alcohol dehydrogenase catalytic domain-containing protein [Novosphingobium sp.]
MKAAVCHNSADPLAIEQRPDPAPGPGEVLIRVERCGICGSELHMRDGPARAFPGGMVMGHEIAGEVVALGEGVAGPGIGRRVAVYPAVGCGACRACETGNQILCPEATRLLGGFAEYAAIPAAAAIELPDHLTPADGALIEPLTVSWYGVRLAELRPGARVVVLGAGTIALSAIYWARRSGAGRIAALSRSPRRAELALRMGADAFLAYGDDEVAEAAEALGGPADAVFECVGAPGFLGKAIDHAGLMGQVLSLGFGGEPDPVIPAVAGFRGVTLQFPVGYSQDDFRHVAREMTQGHVDPKIMISSTVALDDLPATFEELLGANAQTKVQVAPFAPGHPQ